MGRFTDWMMKNDDDSVNDDNNFDKEYGNDYSQQSTIDSFSQPREDRGLFGRRQREESKPVTLLGGDNASSQNVVVFNPKTYEEVQMIIDYLKRHEPVVVDLGYMKDHSEQRLLDFVSGAIYGLSGSIQEIKDSIYLLVPAGVSIMVPKNLGK